MLFLIIIVSLFALIFIASGVISGFIYDAVFSPSSDKSFFLLAPHNKKTLSRDKESKENEPDKSVLKNYAKSVYIKSWDNLKLHAYILENNNNNKWVIMCHGYAGNAMRLKKVANMFYGMGLNLLVLDARGHGKSEGNYIGMGWHERLDVIEWSKLIISKNKNAEILLYGVSMGGATVMMASGEELPKNIKCIIEDCGYTSVWDEFNYQFKKFFKITPFPILNLMSLELKIRAKYSLQEASAINQVKKSTVPMLFIHGSADKFVPTYMVDKLYNAAKCVKEKLIISNAAHAEAYDVSPWLYRTAVQNFIDKYL